jgi:hypothetical protein
MRSAIQDRALTPALSQRKRVSDRMKQAFTIVVALCWSAHCSKQKEEPAPRTWPLIAEGQGTPLGGVESVDTAACGAKTQACADRLRSLGEASIGIVAPPDASLGDVAASLGAIRSALGRQRMVCFSSRDARGSRRCVRALLFTEDDFHAWLDGEESASKLRVVMRADGMEVAGAHGKVPGPDRFGPSIQPQNGRPDFIRLADVVRRLKDQLPDEHEMGVLASVITPFADVVRALAAIQGHSAEQFDRPFVVVPPPATRSARATSPMNDGGAQPSVGERLYSVPSSRDAGS